MDTKRNESDDNVRDSWEELDDLITIPEPTIIKSSSKKKGSSKQSNLQSVSIPDAKSPATVLPPTTSSSSSTPSSSVEPELGKIRILKRNPSQQSSSTVPTASVSAPPTKTYEERVAAYNAARMRILGSIDDEVQSQLPSGAAVKSPTNSASS
ncbi:hypothetical protein BV898_11939 [Hypsibius exemplaris]|uniref:SUZ domain-containing protein n=1 Tax=Hypsibius exemplaris TaxID=2072580 RepID=A0A1W0WF39_HYPEX|nr:hypothetical protein BV898_11939 [Hypsibius exemplaris]